MRESSLANRKCASGRMSDVHCLSPLSKLHLRWAHHGNSDCSDIALVHHSDVISDADLRTRLFHADSEQVALGYEVLYLHGVCSGLGEHLGSLKCERHHP